MNAESHGRSGCQHVQGSIPPPYQNTIDTVHWAERMRYKRGVDSRSQRIAPPKCTQRLLEDLLHV